MGCNNSHDSSENSQGEADMAASRKYSSRRSSSVSNNTGDRTWRRPQQFSSPSSASNSPRSPDTASKRRRRSLLLRQSSPVLSDRDGTEGTEEEGSTDDADWNAESGDTGSRRSDQQRPRRRGSCSGRSTVGTLFDAPAQNGYRLRLKQSNSSDRRTNNDDDEEDEDDDVPTHRSHNQQLAERNRRKRKNSQKKNNQPPPQTQPRYGSLRRTPSMTTHAYSGMSEEEAAKAREEDEQKHLESIRRLQRARLRKGGYLAPNSKLDHYKKLLQTVGRESGEDDDDGWLEDDGVADPSSPDFCADNNSAASGIQVISRKASATSDGWGDVANNGDHDGGAFQPPPPSDDNNSAHSSAQSPRSILRKSSSYLIMQNASQPSSFVGSLRHPSQHASFQGGGLGTRPASVLLGGGSTDEGSDCGGEVSVQRGNDSIFSLQMSGFSTTGGGGSSSGLSMPSPFVNSSNSAPPPQQGTPLQLPEPNADFFDDDDNLPSFIRCDLAPSARGPPSAHHQQLPGAMLSGSATGYPTAQPPHPSAPNFYASASGSLVMGTTTPTSIHSPPFHQQPGGGGGGGSVSSRCSSRSSARVMFRE